jgi:hypothetical protein
MKMKGVAVLVGIILFFSGVSTRGQGQVDFTTYHPPKINAPASYLNGERIGPEFWGELYFGPEGTSIADLKPLGIVERFTHFDKDPEFNGYLVGRTVDIPGIEPGHRAVLMLRAYNGERYESSSIRGESNPVLITLTGGTLPPVFLVGMQPFSVDIVPEPEPVWLFSVGAVAAIFFSRRLKSARHQIHAE